MALVLVPILDSGGAIDSDGNTLATLDYANAYFEGRLDAEAWSVGEDRQGQALLTAMRIMESLPFIGGSYSSTQPFSMWPRAGTNPMERGIRRRVRTGFETLTGASGGLYDRRGRFHAVTTIPVQMKNAQCEIALAMLIDRSLNDMRMRRMLTKSKDMETDYRTPAGFCVASAREWLAGLLKFGVETERG